MSDKPVKAILEFDLTTPDGWDRAMDAMKGRRMSWLIDSFLDYISLVSARDMKKYSAKQIYEEIFCMYCSKIMQAGVIDRTQSDVHYLLKRFIVEPDTFDDETGAPHNEYEDEGVKHWFYDGGFKLVMADGTVQEGFEGSKKEVINDELMKKAAGSESEEDDDFE